MTFYVQWLEKGSQTTEFATERKAERFAAHKRSGGISQVVVFEVGEVTPPPAAAVARDGEGSCE